MRINIYNDLRTAEEISSRNIYDLYYILPILSEVFNYALKQLYYQANTTELILAIENEILSFAPCTRTNYKESFEKLLTGTPFNKLPAYRQKELIRGLIQLLNSNDTMVSQMIQTYICEAQVNSKDIFSSLNYQPNGFNQIIGLWKFHYEFTLKTMLTYNVLPHITNP